MAAAPAGAPEGGQWPRLGPAGRCTSSRAGRNAYGSIRHSDVKGWVADLAASVARRPCVPPRGCCAAFWPMRWPTGCWRSTRRAGVKLPKRPPARHVYLTAAQLSAGRGGRSVWVAGVVARRSGPAFWRGGGAAGGRHRLATSSRDLTRNAVRSTVDVVVGTLKGDKNRTVALPAFVLDALAESCQGKGRDDLMWTTRAAAISCHRGSGSWLASAVARCQAADPTFPG